MMENVEVAQLHIKSVPRWHKTQDENFLWVADLKIMIYPLILILSLLKPQKYPLIQKGLNGSVGSAQNPAFGSAMCHKANVTLASLNVNNVACSWYYKSDIMF